MNTKFHKLLILVLTDHPLELVKFVSGIGGKMDLCYNDGVNRLNKFQQQQKIEKR